MIGAFQAIYYPYANIHRMEVNSASMRFSAQHVELLLSTRFNRFSQRIALTSRRTPRVAVEGGLFDQARQDAKVSHYASGYY